MKFPGPAAREPGRRGRRKNKVAVGEGDDMHEYEAEIYIRMRKARKTTSVRTSRMKKLRMMDLLLNDLKMSVPEDEMTVEESFKPAIYGEDTARYFFPGAVVPTWLQVLGPNYMYGMGRMRILNILPDSECMVAEQYRIYFPTCYGPFNLDAVDREPFGPPNDEGIPTYQFSTEAMLWSVSVRLAFLFCNKLCAEGLNAENYDGWLGSYPPGGYMEMFTPDYPKTNAKFLAMKQDGFISEKTRAIFLDSWTWSAGAFVLKRRAALLCKGYEPNAHLLKSVLPCRGQGRVRCHLQCFEIFTP
eukprot:s3561_g12.t1